MPWYKKITDHNIFHKNRKSLGAANLEVVSIYCWWS